MIKDNYIRYAGSAIELSENSNSIVKCNIMEQNDFGISVGPGPNSTGNILQGNLIIDGFVGINMYGLEFPPDPPNPPLILPVASGNMVKNNVVPGNFRLDMAEIVYPLATGEIYVDPSDTCQNAWMKNQFVTEMGPSNCIGLPVELDEDDVCALDDDD